MAAPKVVSIAAAKAVSVVKAPSAAERSKITEECASLIEQVAPMEKRRDALKVQIASWHPELGKSATATATEESESYVVTIGQQAQVTTITGLDRLAKILGLANFIKFVYACRPTQKALDASIPEPGMRLEFMNTSQTGPRRFSIIKKFGEAA